MKGSGSDRLRIQKIIILIVTLFCLVAFVLPGESHAGFLEWLFPSLSKKTQKTESARHDSGRPKENESIRSKENEPVKPEMIKTFTISKIEANIEKRIINIAFTETCDYNNLRNSLKIFPPVRLHWHNITSNNNIFSIQGEFKAGQDYTIVIPETVECKGRKYIKTLSAFRMPDLEPDIHFLENETVIERDSRQMLHASVTNIDELLFQGLRIPPVLIPSALNEIRHQNPFEKIKENLERKYDAIKKLIGNNEDIGFFLGGFTEDNQLFFPGKERNKAQKFSIPFGFRTDKEKGTSEVIFLKSNRNDQKAFSPVRLFRITDMGITYKISKDSLLVWVTSLNTGKPIADISLLAFPEGSGKIVSLGKTDENGIFFIKNMENRLQISLEENKVDSQPLSLKDILFIAAASPSDNSFIEIKKNGTIKPDWVTMASSPNEKIKLSKGHVFTERGIYRPGEKVYFKGTVREYKDGEILPPAGSKATFTIINSKGEQVYRKEIALSEFGTASDTFDTKSYFPLGTYTVNMQFAAETANSTFEVQEFRSPRHFVEVLFKKEQKKDESYINLNKMIDLLSCNISGNYYAGGPVKHGKVRWKIYYSSTNFNRKDYPDFVFGNTFESDRELLESGESILDEKGKLAVTVPVNRDVLSGVYGMEMVATVVDFDGRASTETAVYQEEPEFLLGISSHENNIKAGDPQILNIIVIDKNGKRMERGTIDVNVMKKE